MATKTKTTHLMTELIAMGEVTHRRHIEKYDGEKCFNLFTFLEALESNLITVLDRRCGRFEVDSTTVARLVWCHMSIASGDSPDGSTFRGMPILD